MTLAALPNLERCERARRVHYDAYNIRFEGDYYRENDDISLILYRSRHVVDRVRDSISRFRGFYRAALLIRSNYSEWEHFVSDSSSPAPEVFESFTEDTVMVFFLFFCDRLNIYNLDPRYQFLDYGRRSPNTCIIYYRDRSRLFSDIKSIIKLWTDLGCPPNRVRFGSKFRIVKTNHSKYIGREASYRGCSELTDAFFFLAHEFDFTHIAIDGAGDANYPFGRLIFVIPGFVANIFVSLAYDSFEVNTLQVVRKLFPDFRDLIPKIVDNYFESVTVPMPAGDSNVEFPVVRKLLEKRFSCKIRYDVYNMNYSPPLYNQSIIATFKSHPGLFDGQEATAA